MRAVGSAKSNNTCHNIKLTFYYIRFSVPLGQYNSHFFYICWLESSITLKLMTRIWRGFDHFPSSFLIYFLSSFNLKECHFDLCSKRKNSKKYFQEDCYKLRRDFHFKKDENKMDFMFPQFHGCFETMIQLWNWKRVTSGVSTFYYWMVWLKNMQWL